jgi:hypothetical protein
MIKLRENQIDIMNRDLGGTKDANPKYLVIG